MRAAKGNQTPMKANFAVLLAITATIVVSCERSESPKQTEIEIVSAVIRQMENPKPYERMFRWLGRKIIRNQWQGLYYFVSFPGDSGCPSELVSEFADAQFVVRPGYERAELADGGRTSDASRSVLISGLRLYGERTAHVQVEIKAVHRRRPEVSWADLPEHVREFGRLVQVPVGQDLTYILKLNTWNRWVIVQTIKLKSVHCADSWRVSYPSFVY
jgi:hypothetical protein